MADLERLASLAKTLLTIHHADGRADPWLWQHSERVARLAGRIAGLPEFAGKAVNRDALYAAGLFHDAGWIVQLKQGRFPPTHVLGKPTSDVQRELGAAFLVEQAGHLLPGPTIETAMDAIRLCNLRQVRHSEAQILSEAENLDDVGVMYVVRQIRTGLCEGRPLDQLLQAWSRQREYKYWDSRIKESFHFDTVRELARVRLAAADRFMTALAAEQAAEDIGTLVATLSAS